MLFANAHKFIHEARRLHPVIYDLQITYHKDQIHRKMISYGYIPILPKVTGFALLLFAPTEF